MGLILGGFLPFSTIDYPGQLAATVFVQGCPWRCPYCHNAALQHLDSLPDAPTGDDVLDVLERRQNQLEAVVFSGGEPTAQRRELVMAMDDVAAMGFKVGLHTAGIYSLEIENVGQRCDWVGFDYKSPISKYPKVTGRVCLGSRVHDVLKVFIETAKSVEVRTTWESTILALADAATMAGEIAAAGATSWTIQRKTGDNTDLEAIAQAARTAVGAGFDVVVRG